MERRRSRLGANPRTLVRTVAATVAACVAVAVALSGCNPNPEGGLPEPQGSLLQPSWSVPPLPTTLAPAATNGPLPVPKGPAISSDYNGDGYGDVVLGSGTYGSGPKVRVLYGSASGLSPNGAQVFERGSDGVPGATAAWGLAIASGNFDGDGYADVAISGHSAQAIYGEVVVLYGSASGLHATAAAKQKAELLRLNPLTGLLPSAFTFGDALAVTDVNLDGRADLAISLGAGIGKAPAVLLLRGDGGGLENVNGDFVSLANIGGSDVTGESHESLAAGDFNGDGRPELAVGLPFTDVGRITEAGMIVMLPSTVSGHLTSTGAYAFTEGSPGVPDVPTMYAFFGGVLATGDVNGDKRDDLAVSEWYEGNFGDKESRVTLFKGSPSGLTTVGIQSIAIPPPIVNGSPWDVGLGWSLAIFDTNGDGYAELAMGGTELDPPAANKEHAGSVRVLAGGPNGVNVVNPVIWTQDSVGVAFSPAIAWGGLGSSLRPLKVKGSPYPILAIGTAREHDPTPCGVLGVLRGSANGLTATGSQVFPANVLPQGVDDYCQTVSAVLG